MNDENERSVASAGSHGAVAWAVMLSSGCIYGLHEEQWEATAICEAMKTHDISHALIVPLYRQPTLTDAEREAVEVAAQAYVADHGERFAATLRALLSRTGSGSAKTGDDAAECYPQAGKCPEREFLTDEVREAVEWFARHSNHGMSMRRSATLRSLLARLSPPAT
jgi:hypothetical protein